jgi:hypothetical protein
MKRINTRIIAAIAVIALLAAGGAAFTTQITGLDGTSNKIGFGKETINGATATDVHYNLSSDGQYVDTVTVTLTGDYHAGYDVKGGLVPNAGDPATLIACTPGSFTSGNTIVTCDFTNGGAGGGTELTGTPVNVANAFDLSVIDAAGQTSRS